ncbi:MAG: methyltransferase domain-containing protein, partial [Patescibacteria group bacterium]
MIKQKLLDNLACINCLKELGLVGEKLVCHNCQREYPVINGQPYLLEKPGEGFKESSSDAIVNKLKVFFKKYPIIFNILYYTLGASAVGRRPKKVIKDLGEDKIILNLGSGIRSVRRDVINVDFYPFAGVDIVADITKLPFKDNSVDAVVCESVLEHIKDPWIIVREI